MSKHILIKLHEDHEEWNGTAFSRPGDKATVRVAAVQMFLL